jgi:hypothetical protein
MLGKRTVLLGVFAGRGPGRVARGRYELFAQFTGNEKFPSPLSPTPTDRRSTAGEGRTMR